MQFTSNYVFLQSTKEMSGEEGWRRYVDEKWNKSTVVYCSLPSILWLYSPTRALVSSFEVS
jgi:hypothetical protein